MTWTELLAEKKVAAEPTNKSEIDSLRAVVERSFHDAGLPDISADGKYSMAYNAARILATIVVRASGYRVKPAGGAHRNTFLALEAALGPSIARLAAYFDTCREKRNELSYEQADVVTDTEADELFKEATQFGHVVETWLVTKHPEHI